jgi:predicted acetyltransferase
MLIFARYAGEWTVAEQSRNPGAIRFWRRVVSIHERQVPGEARPGRDRAHVQERRTGARAGTLTT